MEDGGAERFPERERKEERCGMLSSGHDLAVALSNSEQFCLPSQD